MSTELTKQDRCDWNLHKAICRRNKEGVIETAKSIKIIRDRKLWRAEYDSFEAFAEGIYGRSLSWANKLIFAENTTETQSEPVSLQTSENTPNATENADSAPDATENTVSEPFETSPKPPKSSKPPDPFKKLDDLIGKAIRATDDIGKGQHHDEVLKMLGELLEYVKRWRAV